MSPIESAIFQKKSLKTCLALSLSNALTRLSWKTLNSTSFSFEEMSSSFQKKNLLVPVSALTAIKNYPEIRIWSAPTLKQCLLFISSVDSLS